MVDSIMWKYRLKNRQNWFHTTACVMFWKQEQELTSMWSKLIQAWSPGNMNRVDNTTAALKQACCLT